MTYTPPSGMGWWLKEETSVTQLPRDRPPLPAKRGALRIYVAGPYSSGGGTIEQNVARAVTVCNALLDMGHLVYCPHTMTHSLQLAKNRPSEAWMQLDRSYMEEWADALYFIAPSQGACRELGWAEALGKPVYRSLTEVPTIKHG